MKDEELYFWNGPLPETQAPAPGPAPEPWGETKVVGKPLTRIDAYDRVSGSAVYPSDVILPDMLHAAILSCPHAHAMVKKVDVTEALKMPGVRAILKDGDVGTNIPWFSGRGGFSSRLFDTHCRYEGDEVAVVAADTIYQAWDAVRAIKVDYEVLPQVSAAADAMKPGAPAVRDGGNVIPPGQPYARGDVEAGFKAADAVLEFTFNTPCELHNAMELHGCVAKWDGPRLTVWESTQGVYGVQTGMARALNIPLANIRVIGHYMGGGFGAKLSPGKYSVMAALLAKRTARPVRLFLSREQVCLGMGNRPANTITLKAGVKKDGTLVALQSKTVGSGGAYSDGGTGGVDYVIRELYACPNVRCENQSAYIHAGPERPFRAPGHPQGAWALEIMLDALAAKLGMDPIALRLKNVTEVSQTRNGNPKYTSTGFADCLKNGAATFGWAEARARKPLPSHIRRGVGVAGGMWQGGGGSPPATAIVKLFADGSANLNMGASDIGCGTKTWGAQIVAEELGVPMDRISVEHADTGTTQFATPSGGSKTVPTESPARAAQAARRRPRAAGRRGGVEDRCHQEGGPRPDPGVQPARPARRHRLSRAEPPGVGRQPLRRAIRRGRGQHEDRRDQGAPLPRGARQRPDPEREDVPEPGVRRRHDGHRVRPHGGPRHGRRAARQAAHGEPPRLQDADGARRAGRQDDGDRRSARPRVQQHRGQGRR